MRLGGGLHALYLGLVGIHRADDVGARVAATRFVLHRPRRLMRAHPRRHRVMVPAVARLVAQRPDDDARMVLVALHHACKARYECGPPRARLGEVSLIAQEEAAVRLDVCFIDDVEPNGVAELEPLAVVWVVRAADGVDRVRLHQLRIEQHALPRHGLAVVWAVVMAVDAAKRNRAAVEMHEALLDRHHAQSDPARFAVDQRAVLVPQLDEQRVEIWRLRGPQPRVVKCRVKGGCKGAGEQAAGLGDLGAVLRHGRLRNVRGLRLGDPPACSPHFGALWRPCFARCEKTGAVQRSDDSH